MNDQMLMFMDYLPQVMLMIVAIYNGLQMVRWAERGKLRWLVYGLIAGLSVLAFEASRVQLEAIYNFESQYEPLSSDCTTDAECELENQE